VEAVTWCWRKWIAPNRQEDWIARLDAAGCANWTLTEQPQRKRHLLAVYAAKREPVEALRGPFGGRVAALRPSQWLAKAPAPATRIGNRLEILHHSIRRRLAGNQLVIPHGLAFGSGEHATTFMLLRALTQTAPVERVLDLGTGSGMLALAARRLGARTIVATDFDPAAVRTARENERRNFPRPLIRWRQADVKNLSATVRYDLVLANLFSGILVEAAPRIGACVASGGQLWLSGILRDQQDEVDAAYRAQGLQFVRATRRGKWVMLRFQRPAAYIGEGGLRTTIQTK
jgi:ribosomal protein L11 methyltransferase